jgi:hypothetical protein
MAEAIVVTAEFRLKPGHVDEWLRLMLDHDGPACVSRQLRRQPWCRVAPSTGESQRRGTIRRRWLAAVAA